MLPDSKHSCVWLAFIADVRHALPFPPADHSPFCRRFMINSRCFSKAWRECSKARSLDTVTSMSRASRSSSSITSFAWRCASEPAQCGDWPGPDGYYLFHVVGYDAGMLGRVRIPASSNPACHRRRPADSPWQKGHTRQ
jgi:hypothetical protein